MQSPTSLSQSTPKDPLPVSYILIPSLLSLLLLFTLLSLSPTTPPPPPTTPTTHPLPHPTPSLAYHLSSPSLPSLLRLLFSSYHPNNLYLLHLDLAAPQSHRDKLALLINANPLFRAAGNVHVVGKPDNANPKGSSALAATLHAAAILLRVGSGWDWFVNLDDADYPLVTQDDLLHVLSYLPKDLNFVQHSGRIGWRESRRMRPIVVDPGLYHSSRADIFYATQKRELPNAYRLFTGSGSVILSRKFVEYCILGTDNLPRTTLMYYANMLSSHTNYFQTVLCNSPEFNRTVVNHNLHRMLREKLTKQVPQELTLDEFKNMTVGGSAFASGFSHDDMVLDHIDQEILGRSPNRIVPGGWCLGEGEDPCTVWGNANVLRPGSGATKLAEVITQVLSSGSLHSNQCIWD